MRCVTWAVSIFGEQGLQPIDSGQLRPYIALMDTMDLDQLQGRYKQTVDEWISAIEAEEALATSAHSMVEMERWDTAGLKLHDAELTAKKARDEYKNALRQKNYGF